MADRSSTSALASVMTASVVSGSISDTDPTKVVLPTPNPPATTILAEVVVGTAPGSAPASSPSSEPSKSTQHPFHQRHVRNGARGRGGLVDHDDAGGGHVTDQHARDAERQLQQGRHLGDRLRVAAEVGHRAVLITAHR